MQGRAQTRVAPRMHVCTEGARRRGRACSRRGYGGVYALLAIALYSPGREVRGSAPAATTARSSTSLLWERTAFWARADEHTCEGCVRMDPADFIADAEAIAVDVSVPLSQRALALRKALRQVAPGRRRVASAANPDVRVGLQSASIDELLAALRQDAHCNAFRLRGPANAFKAVEAVFKRPGNSILRAGAAGGPAAAAAAATAAPERLRGLAATPAPPVCTIADAVAAGALDFSSPHAAWRTDEAECERLGITCFAAAASDTNEDSWFSPRGGVYGLRQAPGFYILPRALTRAQQEYWVRRTLRDFMEPPNRRNVDAFSDPDYSNVVAAAGGGGSDSYAAAMAATTDAVPAHASAPSARVDGARAECVEAVHAYAPGAGAAVRPVAKEQGASSCPRAIDGGGTGLPPTPSFLPTPVIKSERTHRLAKPNESKERPAFEARLWKSYCTQYMEQAVSMRDAPPPVVADDAPPCVTLERCSWATLGHQYDWTARQYHLPTDADYASHVHAYDAGAGSGTACPAAGSRWSAPFPSDLAAFSAAVAAVVNQCVGAKLSTRGDAVSEDELECAGLPMSLIGEAGICNLYDARRTLPMGAHVDDMERDYSFPVVSMSLGCTAIFLVGGSTKQVPPIPVLLRSGDIMLLSGASRLAFHGVARVWEGTAPADLFSNDVHSGSHGAGGAEAGCVADEGASPCAAWRPYAGACGASHDAVEEACFRHFLRHVRVNINVRQVQAR
ncbi:hypothetical protein EON62_00560, partial [archaeon]